MKHDVELLARLGPAEYARRLKRVRRRSKHHASGKASPRGLPRPAHDAARGEELLRQGGAAPVLGWGEGGKTGAAWVLLRRYV